MLSGAAVVALLLVLGLRSVLRLDTWWDSWLYHIPFAARYGGLGIPYTSRPEIEGVFQGFPPLPFVVHGLLWRVTGSLYAIGIRNCLAFLAYLYFCHRVLRARFVTVALVALTTPLVLIHLTTTYYDLFAAVFLAMAVSGCAVALLFERWQERRLLGWILLGLVLASWSKFVLVPWVALVFVLLLVRYGMLAGPARRRYLVGIAAAAVIAALPYLKNWVLYRNPFWPYPVPYFTHVFAHGSGWSWSDTRPHVLEGRPQVELFFRSLLELGHPSSHANRARWTIDQGASGDLDFRSGGFWAPAVLTYLTAAMGLLVLYSTTKAARLLAALVVVLVGCAVLPYSHQLRYLLFVPLTWAAILGVLERHFAASRPWLMSGLLAVALGLAGYMGFVNRQHLRVERVSYAEAARYWGQSPWWRVLEPGQVYCVVGQTQPSAYLLTGPTGREFTIHERGARVECPTGDVILDWTKPPALASEVAVRAQSLVTEGCDLVYAKHLPKEGIPRFEEALKLAPEHYGARWQLAHALELAGEREAAKRAWKQTITLELLRGYRGAEARESRRRVDALSRESVASP